MYLLFKNKYQAMNDKKPALFRSSLEKKLIQAEEQRKQGKSDLNEKDYVALLQIISDHARKHKHGNAHLIWDESKYENKFKLYKDMLEKPKPILNANAILKESSEQVKPEVEDKPSVSHKAKAGRRRDTL